MPRFQVQISKLITLFDNSINLIKINSELGQFLKVKRIKGYYKFDIALKKSSKESARKEH